ncbi:MAG: tRNA uridine-5-carboxymethylaminomethyl(34) synthesis GTPase MnmE [Alphaproteobacteria bacterium]|nr:tRNA uridine-5-carboxymethylaminomethyl(34) synthesis GTPase MnmE [Alphaproteobacteria bacterium]
MGRAGVAVVRVSGRDLSGLLKKIRNQKSEIRNRIATLADLKDDAGEIIDRAIVIYFQGPNSFTGEDVIEFHTHGSDAVIQKLFDCLRAMGARMANPGEFARRAFDNNKMDLVAVDGLAALIDSRTERQRRAALRAAAGADSAVYMRWRAEMVDIAAYAAAMLDYPADELPANIGEILLARTQSLHDEIAAALARAGAARAVRSGFNIAIVGPVNAGKSSLFNRLIGESRAIVSDVPGTTRDVVSAEIDIDGYLVRILDTAGLRETDDVVENLGIERTHAEIENADLVIRVCDDNSPQWEESQNGASHDAVGGKQNNEIVIYNKCDIMPPTGGAAADSPQGGSNCPMRVSALTGEGIPKLLEIIKHEVHARLDNAESEVVVNERTKGLLEQAAAELKSAVAAHGTGHEIFAEHVRIASDKIGQTLGIIGADEVMDSVFGQLCLGK